MAALNIWRNRLTQTESARHGLTVVTSDVNDLANTTRGLRVKTAGDVKVTFDGGETDIIPAVQPGETIPVQVSRIWTTGTTATGIFVMW